MPKRRFDRLDSERRALILDVAAQEFAKHGFDGTSYNQIISRAGASKGAMYYYFEDKEDLYATVLTHTLTGFLESVGQIEAPRSAEHFWGQAEQLAGKSVEHWRHHPTAMALLKGIAAAAASTSSATLLRLDELARGWWLAFVTHGQRVGAVRSDLPTELLITILVGASGAVDRWIAEYHDQFAEDELRGLGVRLYDILRRVASP